MKKLLVITAIVTMLSTTMFAQQLPGISARATAGYTSKVVEFGKASNGAYTAGADLAWQSFSVGVLTYNDLAVSPFSAKLNRVDLTAAYKLFSTLADVNVGAAYVHVNNAGKFDFSGHWRPFVTVSKGFYAVTAAYDTQSRLSNIEGKLFTSVETPLVGVSLVPAVFVGYTDVNDALPKTVKEIKYTNAYFGAGADVTYKWLSVGGLVLHDGQTNHTTGVWHAYATYKF